LNKDNFVLDFVTNIDHYSLRNQKEMRVLPAGSLVPQDFVIYHIEEITYEEESPRKDAFENVLSALRIPGVSFLYLMIGNENGAKFYFGVVKNLHEKNDLPLTVSEMGDEVLSPSITGNFRGSKVKKVDRRGKEDVLQTLQELKYVGIFEGVPGVNEDSEDIQGVDRLADIMMGDEYAVAILSRPMSFEEIHEIESKLSQAYNGIAPFAKQNIQEGQSTNNTVGKTEGSNVSTTSGSTTSEGTSSTHTTNESTQDGSNKSTQQSTGKNKSSGSSHDNTTTTTSNSGTEGTSHSKTEGTSEAKGTTASVGKSTSETAGESKTVTTNEASGKSHNLTIEFVNKKAQDWMKYLDEVILPRIDYGKGKGLFVTTAFTMARKASTLIKLGNSMMALYSGMTGNRVPLHFEVLDPRSKYIPFLRNLQIPVLDLGSIASRKNEIEARTALSQFLHEQHAYLGSWMSTAELSLMAGLPQKEVIGLGLREEVEFGLNFKADEDDGQIEVGCIVQSGRPIENIKVKYNKNNLNKHTFVTGVTGSGKTTTCQKLLVESDLPFLVIEPAKTEYRVLTQKYPDLIIFTLGKNTVAPFRLNPFEFFPHESITSRVDMIKASMEASFHMEAAIPQILEKAIYECYKDLGWNISTNKNERFGDEAFAEGVYAFPVVEQLVDKIEVVVNEQGFDERLKNDYIGSIKARLQGLLVGSKGLMLNTKRSVDFRLLLERRVVLELEEIKSGSEKSLVMGFILTNLIEALKAKYAQSGEYKHITLIEEAHRLLSKYEHGDSMNKKQGVEVFTDMLAEVRKYGEGLIIVDQIPNKLTPEVLKNTNTKIVHRIFAQDDKEAIGNTMALSDEQKDFLSQLETGRVIMFTQGWNKPIQVQFGKTTDKTGVEEVSEEVIREKAMQFYLQTYRTGIWPGFENRQKPTLKDLKEYLEFLQKETVSEPFIVSVNKRSTTKQFEQAVRDLADQGDLELALDYLVKRYYSDAKQSESDERRAKIKRLFTKTLNNEFINHADFLGILF
jgi:DNA helicase HerA-like ATPase